MKAIGLGGEEVDDGRDQVDAFPVDFDSTGELEPIDGLVFVFLAVLGEGDGGRGQLGVKLVVGDDGFQRGIGTVLAGDGTRFAFGGEEKGEDVRAVGGLFTGRSAVDGDAVAAAMYDDTDFGGGSGAGFTRLDGAEKTGKIGSEIGCHDTDVAGSAVLPGEGKVSVGEKIGECEIVEDAGGWGAWGAEV
jgi:hypothetical protein